MDMCLYTHKDVCIFMYMYKLCEIHTSLLLSLSRSHPLQLCRHPLQLCSVSLCVKYTHLYLSLYSTHRTHSTHRMVSPTYNRLVKSLKTPFGTLVSRFAASLRRLWA